MFQKLKQRWKVNGINLILILLTFALGGSLCGYLGRKLLLLTGIDKGVVWIIAYIVLVTLLWPICVLLISIPLGQFDFFRRYIKKIGRKLHGKKTFASAAELKQIAIFASGTGSNARQIIEHFAASTTLKVALIVTNNSEAGVVKIASEANIPVLMIERKRFFEGDHYIPELHSNSIDFIILAGFLWKIPQPLITAYPEKIINIHPALLPKYGGKGMYGSKVHEAVIAANEKESGITIHYVDEWYDHGAIIFQAKCLVETIETADTLAKKIHALEHKHYPVVIETLLQKAKS